MVLLSTTRKWKNTTCCAETSSTGRFFAYYKDGTYSTGRADALDYYEGLAPYTLPDGKLPSEIVGMVFPKDWWRTLVFFRGSGTHGTLANGLYMNLSFYPTESYHYPLIATVPHPCVYPSALDLAHVPTCGLRGALRLTLRLPRGFLDPFCDQPPPA